jgi:hypothetical protein
VCRLRAPPTLRAIASAAWRAGLIADLDGLETEAAAAAAQSSNCECDEERTACAGAGEHPRSFGGDSCADAWCCEGSAGGGGGGGGGAGSCSPVADGKGSCSARSPVVGALLQASVSSASSAGCRDADLIAAFHLPEVAPPCGACGGADAASDDDDDESTCGVCLEPPVSVALLRGCGHRLCTACARGVVGAVGKAPTACPVCPFCRGTILGFDRA